MQWSGCFGVLLHTNHTICEGSDAFNLSNMVRMLELEGCGDDRLYSGFILTDDLLDLLSHIARGFLNM